MGIYYYISSTSNSVIQNVPDLTTVKGWGSSSYGYGWAAVAKVDDVVRKKVIQSMQDEEARSKICRIAKSATFFACEEGLKTIPGLSLQLPTLSHSSSTPPNFVVLRKKKMFSFDQCIDSSNFCIDSSNFSILNF